jgi:hypothetical protein
MYTARFSPTLLRAPGSLLLKKRTQKTESCAIKKIKYIYKKLRTKRGSFAKKERMPVLSTGFKAHCNDDKEKEEKQGRTRCKKEQQRNAESAAKAKQQTQQHLFPRRAWNFERDAVSKWEQGHVYLC